MKNHGLTLIEVMIVITILAVLATMSLQIANGPLVNQRLRKSADVIRTEWTRLRIKAMEDGHLYCFRCTLGGDRFQVDRILDVNFSAGIQTDDHSYQTDSQKQREDETMDIDQLSDGDFTLQDPSMESGKVVTKENLPETCYFADGGVKPDIRADYYTESITSGTGYDGVYWSEPIFFYPDGTTSTATFLLKNDFGRCIEVHLRGLTGITAVSDLSSPENYRGTLNAHNGRSAQSEKE